MVAVFKQKSLGVEHPLIAAAIVFVVWVILLGLFGSVLNHFLVGFFSNNPAWLRISLELESLLSIVAVITIGRVLFNNANPISSPSRICIAFVVGLVAGLLWFGLSFCLFVLSNSVNFSLTSSVSYLPIWLSACFVNAIFQEVLIRGYIFDLLIKGKGEVFATVITTIVFVVLHPGAFIVGPIAVLQIAAASIFLTLLRLLTQGLSAPIAAHALWNMLGGVIFGVVNLADDYPQVLDTQIVGSWWIAGGSMGLEGSLVTLVVTSILCVLALVLVRYMRSNRDGSYEVK